MTAASLKPSFSQATCLMYLIPPLSTLNTACQCGVAGFLVQSRRALCGMQAGQTFPPTHTPTLLPACLSPSSLPHYLPTPSFPPFAGRGLGRAGRKEGERSGWAASVPHCPQPSSSCGSLSSLPPSDSFSVLFLPSCSDRTRHFCILKEGTHW